MRFIRKDHKPSTEAEEKRLLFFRRLPVTSRSHVLIIIFGMATSAIIIALLLGVIFLPSWSGADEKGKPLVCKTSPCIRYAYYLESSINIKTSPCDDFYQYVCGSWFPTSKHEVSVGDGLYIKIMRGIISKAKNHPTISRGRATNKAADMLKACLSAHTRTEENVVYLKRFMAENNMSWPVPPQVEIHPLELIVTLAAKWRTEFIFRIMLTSRNRSTIVMLYPGAHISHLNETHAPLDEFDTYVNKHAELFDQSVSGTTITQLVTTQNEVQRVVTSLTSPLKYPSVLSPMRLVKERNLSVIDGATWASFLEKHVNKGDFVIDGSIDENAILFVTDKRLLIALDHLLQLPHTQLVSFITWKFVERFGLILSSSINEIQTAYDINFYCCTFVEEIYGFALSANYTMNIAEDSERNTTDKFMGNITESVKDMLRNTYWTPDTVIGARRKLDAMIRWVWVRGLTNYLSTLDRFYMQFPYMEGSFTLNWIECNKVLWSKSNTFDYVQYIVTSDPRGFRYLHAINGVQLPVTLTFQPMYHKDLAGAINYAGLGAVYAETIAHAFDYSGIMFDSENRLVSWMSDESLKTIDKKFKCYQDAENTHAMWASIGLEAAYKAFQDSINWEKHLQTLVNFTHYSPSQLFFVAYCFAACSYTGYNRYSVRNKAGCNFALQQSRDFAEAFQCANSSTMNPNRKCTFWT
ncbi:neprilysin-1-like [Ornithodoros turicata]|uniref:neprilysin-1-like n=1 Tax=Ornithodoros turicata TaxID=34597 RepID=UPI0031392928